MPPIRLPSQRNSHIYAFDLLRVIALLGVLLYHFAPRQAPLGLLGVVGFFVLAAYLCMLKAIERRPEQTISENLLRRIVKIYPPLVLMLSIVGLIMIISFPEFLDNFAGQLRSALVGGNNLYQILKGESYFEGAGYLKPLVHLWALSLELQFYLFFYCLIYRFYSRRNRDLWLILFILLTLISLIWLNLLYSPELEPSRLYYGFDTRFSAFGIGLIAALIRHEFWPVKSPAEERLSPGQLAAEDRLAQQPADFLTKVQHFLLNFAALAFSILLFLSFFYPLPLELVLRAALFVYALIFALVMILTASSDNWLASLGRSRVIQYLAGQSYLLYLWHYPIMRFVERYLAFVELPAWAYPLISLALSFFVAELCRLLTKLCKKLWQEKSREFSSHGSTALRAFWQHPSRAISLALGLLLLCLPWQQIYRVSGGEELRQMQARIEAQESLQEQNREARMAELQRRKEAARFRAEQESKQETQPTEQKPTATGPGGWALKHQIRLPEIPQLSSEQKNYLEQSLIAQINNLRSLADPGFKLDLDAYWRYRHIPLSMIGDSVSVIASYHIEPYLPFLYLDALSNRQMSDLWQIYSELKSYDLIGEMLIVALSTNGDVVTEQLEKVWQDLDGKPMLIVTIALPYPGQEEYRNNDLRNFAAKHEQVWLVEWDKNSKNHPEFFMDDLIHPSDPLGCQAFCHLLAAKVSEICSQHEAAGLLEITELANLKPLAPSQPESPEPNLLESDSEPQAETEPKQE
ncbi:MAG: acyltransferase family protein [Eubacteriales bacterium]|nr:acyltransferase family protein [Eubacteriales bacterium]